MTDYEVFVEKLKERNIEYKGMTKANSFETGFIELPLKNEGQELSVYFDNGELKEVFPLNFGEE